MASQWRLGGFQGPAVLKCEVPFTLKLNHQEKSSGHLVIGIFQEDDYPSQDY